MGEVWRREKNRDIKNLSVLFVDLNAVSFIKLGRLKWAGHVARMSTNEIPKKAMTKELHFTRQWKVKDQVAGQYSIVARTFLGVQVEQNSCSRKQS